MARPHGLQNPSRRGLSNSLTCWNGYERGTMAKGAGATQVDHSRTPDGVEPEGEKGQSRTDTFAQSVEPMRQRERSVRSEKRILVVDDDFHSREGLRLSLIEEGYVVETAADGWEAFKKLKEGPFEVAIIDLDLPTVHDVTLSGWDVARFCRAYYPTISIMVVSEAAGREVRGQAEQFKVSALLRKPIDPVQLKAIVSARLRP